MGSTIITVRIIITIVIVIIYCHCHCHCQYMTMKLDKIYLGGHGKMHSRPVFNVTLPSSRLAASINGMNDRSSQKLCDPDHQAIVSGFVSVLFFALHI